MSGVFFAGMLVASALVAGVDIGNMNGCVADVRTALQQMPYDAPNFDQYKYNFSGLVNDLTNAAHHMPTVYQQAYAMPVIQFLTDQLGEEQFFQVFSGPPQDEESAMLQEVLPDLCLAILAYGNNPYQPQATAAFEELVSDFYLGFLAKERTDRIPTPPLEVLAPLVKWGNPDAGPYTLPVDATSQFGIRGVAVVSLPPPLAQAGLISWVSLGHETGGHDVVHAYPNLLNELKREISAKVYAQFKSQALANYWANCIDESISDVCGMLNVGPTAGLGLIAFFRGMMPDGKLRVIGGMQDPHPIDVLRGFMASKLVSELNFSGAAEWSKVIYNESVKDLGGRKLYLVDERTGQYRPFPVDTATAIKSAYVAADVLVNAKLSSLGGHSFKDIENWTNADQAAADMIGAAMRAGKPLPPAYEGDQFYAAHVVAAAAQEAFRTGSNIPSLFRFMISYLNLMNQENLVWASASAHALAISSRSN